MSDLQNSISHFLQAQYIFLHEAILAGVTSDSTLIPMDQLAQRMAELEEDGEAGYQEEFDVRSACTCYNSTFI